MRNTPRSWLVRVVAGAALLAPAACSTDHTGTLPRPDSALNSRWQRAGDAAGTGQWSGADGTSSTALPDGRVAWFFSDTFLGPVNPDGSRTGRDVAHNSLVLQDGDRMTTVRAGTPVRPPPGVPGWYWAGAGHAESGRLVEFYHRLTGASGWDFTEQGVAMATFSLPSMRLESVRELPLVPPQPGRTPVMWGSALLDDGGWTYIYGYRAHLDRPGHPKWLYLARAPRGHLSDLTTWQYAGAHGWTADPAGAVEQPTRVDAGFGVVRVGAEPGAEYALVTKRPSGSLTDGALVADLAASPAGPFRGADAARIYNTPEPLAGEFVYEARVHPEFGRSGEIVVSYNVNSTLKDANCVPQNLRSVSVYRPRFVDVPVTAFRRGYRAPPARGPTAGPGWVTTCTGNH